MLHRLALVALLSLPLAAQAKGTHRPASSQHHATPATHRAPGAGPHRTKAPGVRRDAHGKIQRDPRAKASFRRSHPCPSTGRTSGACPGYEVDHVKPLACGGADAPANMQWLSARANRAKGARECGR